MLEREHIEFIHEMGPPYDEGQAWSHPFSWVKQLTGNRPTGDFFHKLLNITVGWAPHEDGDEFMIRRAYEVWTTIKDMIKHPCYFSCDYLHYSGSSINWSVAIMINFQNLDDYETALTIMKLVNLERTRKHF